MKWSGKIEGDCPGSLSVDRGNIFLGSCPSFWKPIHRDAHELEMIQTGVLSCMLLHRKNGVDLELGFDLAMDLMTRDGDNRGR